MTDSEKDGERSHSRFEYDKETQDEPISPAVEPYRDHEGWAGGCLGALFGGIVIPFCFGLFAAFVLNDLGGPLFWPIFACAGLVVGALVGALIGFVVHFVRNRHNSVKQPRDR